MRRRAASLVVIGWAALAAVPAVADQLLAGKRLTLRTPAGGQHRVIHVARDAGLVVGNAGGTGDPQCTGSGAGGASSLRVVASGGADDVVIPLPCAGWTTNASNTLYRYRDSSGATCRLVLVKHHALAKAVCVGPQVSTGVGAGMAPVAVQTTLNTERYCTAYGGTIVADGSDGEKFVARDSSAPSGCPATSTTTSTSSTTSTSLSYCCGFPGRCVFLSPSQPSELCEQAGGSVSPDSGCDGGTGGCVAGSGAPGPCCQRDYIVPHQVACEGGPSVTGATCVTGGNWIASYYPSAVCTVAGTCQP